MTVKYKCNFCPSNVFRRKGDLVYTCAECGRYIIKSLVDERLKGNPDPITIGNKIVK